jgi:hypothetical protein
MREVERVGHANQSENWPQQHRPLKQFVQNLLASALQLIDLIQNQNSEIQLVKVMQQKNTLKMDSHLLFASAKVSVDSFFSHFVGGRLRNVNIKFLGNFF